MPASQLTRKSRWIYRFGASVAIAFALASAPRFPDFISPAWKVNVVNYLIQVGVTDFPTVTK